ncbi:MAG: hypothetical protein R2755_14570 [Acidimicrobiales bacterium]
MNAPGGAPRPPAPSGVGPLPLLAGALDALQAEAAATGTDQQVVLGGARLHRARSTLLRATFVVDTGERRLTDAPWCDLVIVHAATGRTARVERAVSWQDDRLVVETVELDPAVIESMPAGGAEEAGSWYVVATAGRRRLRLAQHHELGALIDPGHGRFVATGELDARQSRLLAGDPSLLRCALAAAAVELLTDGRRVLVVSPDPVALDEIALVVEQLHDADANAALSEALTDALAGGPAIGFGTARLAPGVVVRIGTPALDAVAGDARLTLEGALDRHAPGALAELGDIAAELRHLAADADPIDGHRSDRPGLPIGGGRSTAAPTDPASPERRRGPSLAARLLAGDPTAPPGDPTAPPRRPHRSSRRRRAPDHPHRRPKPPAAELAGPGPC